VTTLATSKNLTYLGIATIIATLASAAVTLLSGGMPNLGAVIAGVMTGVTAIMAKGAKSTGGTVPETTEAVARTTPAASAPVAPVPSVPFKGPLAILLALGLTSCATLSHVSGSTGTLDLGKGYVFSAVASDTDPATCPKQITTTVTGPKGFKNTTVTVAPVPKDATGTCAP
jgi:hypothetical protein